MRTHAGAAAVAMAATANCCRYYCDMRYMLRASIVRAQPTTVVGLVGNKTKQGFFLNCISYLIWFYSGLPCCKSQEKKTVKMLRFVPKDLSNILAI